MVWLYIRGSMLFGCFNWRGASLQHDAKRALSAASRLPNDNRIGGFYPVVAFYINKSGRENRTLYQLRHGQSCHEYRILQPVVRNCSTVFPMVLNCSSTGVN